MQAAQKAIDTSEIEFREGVIGVPRARRFQLLERPGSPIRLLQSLDIDGFALPVIDPFLADPGYQPKLGARVANALGIGDESNVLMLVVTCLEQEGPLANLRAPLVINVDRRIGLQVILDDRSLPLRAPVSMET